MRLKKGEGGEGNTNGQSSPIPSPSKHSIAGKMARAVALAAAGKTEEAHRIVAAMERQEARKAAKSNDGEPNSLASPWFEIGRAHV